MLNNVLLQNIVGHVKRLAPRIELFLLKVVAIVTFQIAAKLDFQTGTLVEVCQRNDNQLPNSFFLLLFWLKYFQNEVGNPEFSRQA